MQIERVNARIKEANVKEQAGGNLFRPKIDKLSAEVGKKDASPLAQPEPQRPVLGEVV